MSGRPLRIRLAVPDDADGCAFVHHTSWVETYSALLPVSHWETDTLERRTESWRRSLSGGKTVTVAEAGGQIIGIALTNPASPLGAHEPVRDVELSSLYVLAVHHGAGVGQALLENVLPPGTSAQLWAAESNSRARRFYERNGFLADGARYVDETVDLPEVRHVR